MTYRVLSWFSNKFFQLFAWIYEIMRPIGSLETAIGNTIDYFRNNDRTRLRNPRSFDQVIKFKEGRDTFIQFYSLCFKHNKGKVFDTTPAVKAMEAVKANMECCEEINFVKYPDNINSIDDLIIYLKVVRDCPEVLIMEM